MAKRWDPKEPNSAVVLSEKMKAIGKHVAHIMRELLTLGYPTSEMEVVVDNIAEEIAHQSTPFTYSLSLHANIPINEQFSISRVAFFPHNKTSRQGDVGECHAN